MKENRRAVLLAEVRSLTIDLRRVVHGPERLQKFVVAQFLWIESHLHHFGVTGSIRANIFVRRALGFSPAIPHDRIDHSRNLPKLRFNSPEASGTERCNFLHWLLHLLSPPHFNSLALMRLPCPKVQFSSIRKHGSGCG